jgi:maltose alpha-D-glucosyltransferase/alpha-amylase
MTEPDWYKDALFYELRVRSFFDSDGDGIGDFKGLTHKLDYLMDLGVTALWLLPFYPSPMRDDGYDIADYFDVHPAVGKLDDFRRFVDEAHRRDLQIVTELVLNHTSDQHAWFQRARRAPPGSPERDFYVWSDTSERYEDVRIIFTDYETSNWNWDPIAKAYFWHRFFSHQPDLNFDNPAVRAAMFQVVDFWFGLGVDGLRLDAVPYLFEREGTNSENLPETHAYLRELRAHVDRKYQGKMLLAEANQWPEDAVAYFGAGNECHMAFHFPIMPRLYLALRIEDSFPILDILEQTPAIPESAQWALFLRNHDELTLEMVSEDERDLMLRAYGREREMRINLGIRRRLAPLLDSSRRRIELLNALLFSLPGTPVIYYGDEIGMGDNVYLGDRNGVRTPMQWSPDRNAGFSRANPQSLILPPVVDPEYHYEAINVETQEKNPSSLLWWMKRLIALRKQYSAFGRGSFEPLTTSNRAILAFLRRHGDSVLLVVMNLSRFTQCVDLNLDSVRGRVPVELFGQSRFPPIGRTPYQLTFGPHDFFWFSLEEDATSGAVIGDLPPPVLRVGSHWSKTLVGGRPPAALSRALAQWLKQSRWFRAKSRGIRQVEVADSMQLGAGVESRLTLLDATLSTGESESYVTFLGVKPGKDPDALVHVANQSGAQEALIDTSTTPGTARTLLDLFYANTSLVGAHGELVAQRVGELPQKPGPDAVVRVIGDHSNTSYVVDESVVVKLLRKVEEGPSVEVELLRELEPRAHELGLPRLFGSLELTRERRPTVTLASVVEYVKNQGDAWRYVSDEVLRFFERVLVDNSGRTPPVSVALVGEPTDPTQARELLAGLLEAVRQLGRRTGKLHRALGESSNPDFEPRPFGALVRRAAYQALRTRAVRSFDVLSNASESLSGELREVAAKLLARRKDADLQLRGLLEASSPGMLIRVHGDFHLGQVLYTGNDFGIIDFEGEPGKTLAERRRHRSPLVDVAGMLRSFHYAAESVLAGGIPVHGPRELDVPRLRPWARAWCDWVSHAFVAGYLEVMTGSELIPEDAASFRQMLDVFVMEKALYELVYELDNRPSWVGIPLQGLLASLPDA